MELLNIVALVVVSDNKLPDFLERNVMGLTSAVKQLSPTDAEESFERIWWVIQPCRRSTVSARSTRVSVKDQTTCMDHFGVAGATKCDIGGLEWVKTTV